MRIQLSSASTLSLLIVLFSAAAWAITPTSPAAVVASGPDTITTAVRVEYVALAGNNPRTDTVCHLVNRSIGGAITIERITVLGAGGRTDVLGSNVFIASTVIRPLGEHRVVVNSSIPGLLPQTSVNANGARVLLVEWSGPSDALQLSATIVRFATGQTDMRAHVIERGFQLTP